VPLPPEPAEALFLTVQPNHEVLVYLDEADASAVWPLARMARRTSAPGDPVQTFVLTRETVYQALESGLGLEEVRRFLQEHSRTGLADNVAASLAEWGRKREALVIRTGVTLAAAPAGRLERVTESPRARHLSHQFVLLPRTTARAHAPARAGPAWRVDAEGLFHATLQADSIALARLGQFTDPAGDGWQMSAASVRRARDRGIPADQVIGWAEEHLDGPLPPLVETRLRNWAGAARVFLGPLLMLQVADPRARDALLGDAHFRSLLAGHVPPDWFAVRPEGQAEIERFLTGLGFSLTGSARLAELPAAEGVPAEAEDTEAPRRRGRPKRR
jgi:hypothetical protein